jgi:hypothetical protein
MILWGGGKGVFSLSRVPPCRLFLMGTGGETKVAFLAAVRGGELLSILIRISGGSRRLVILVRRNTRIARWDLGCAVSLISSGGLTQTPKKKLR